VPGVLAGIAVALFSTHTSLNIESFMGSIMCLGVSVSNSVMLVTFMNEHWKGGASAVEAAIVGAGERLRPILMTACAMTVGMVPMALALEKGSQMQAPLGLAVIGGLVMSTFATLLVLPSIFAVVIGSRVSVSPSIYPDDPDSIHYDPHAYDEVDEKVTPGTVEHLPTQPHSEGHRPPADVRPLSTDTRTTPREYPNFPGDL
jgi:AcrB/AcrD/AcrF family